jgi:hypothetical protein
MTAAPLAATLPDRARSRGPAPARPVGPSGTGPGRAPGGAPGPGTGPRGASGPSEARSLLALAETAALLYLEVEAGLRPMRSARPLLDPALLERLADVWVRGGSRRHLLRIAGRRTAPDRYDAVAVVSDGARTGAVALGLRRTSGRWRLVEALRPEDGALPEVEQPAVPVAAAEPIDDEPIPAAARAVAERAAAVGRAVGLLGPEDARWRARVPVATL